MVTARQALVFVDLEERRARPIPGAFKERMRAFEGPEEFLLSLQTAQVLRRPRSLLYLQSLKWAAQAKERVR